MKCVALAGRHPVYELTAADLVVRSLGEIAFVNLKQLFRLEEQRLPEVGGWVGGCGPCGRLWRWSWHCQWGGWGERELCLWACCVKPRRRLGCCLGERCYLF